jgi:YHS domain-containing protein
MNLKISRLAVPAIINVFFIIVLIATVSSCHSNQQQSAVSPAIVQAASEADSTKPKFTVAMVDNKMDPSCGMPLTAGIGDTVHFKGKVYGFCSDECKQIFLKNPDSLSKKVVMK